MLAATALGNAAATKPVADPGGAYSFVVPADWRVSIGKGGARATHPAGGATVTAVVGTRADANLEAFAARLIQLQHTQSPARKETARHSIDLCGLPAVLIQAACPQNGVATREATYLVLTEKRQYCFTMLCAEANLARDAEAFGHVFASLTIEGRTGAAEAKEAPQPTLSLRTPEKPEALRPIPELPPATAPEPPSEQAPDVTVPLPARPDTPTLPKPGQGKPGQGKPGAAPFAMKAVRDPRGAWTTRVPADWRVADNGQFTMAASPDQRANVTIWAGRPEAATLEQWFQAMLPALKRNVTRWRLIGQARLTLAGLQGLHVRAETLTRGVPMHVDYAMAQTRSKAILVTCNCPKADFPRNQLKFGYVLHHLRFPLDAAVRPPQPAPRPATSPATTTTPRQLLAMRRTVSNRGGFLFYLPQGWSGSESVMTSARALSIVDARGALSVSVCVGTSPPTTDVVALTGKLLNGMWRQSPNLRLTDARRGPQRRRMTVSGSYTDRTRVRKDFRCWVMLGQGMFTYYAIAAPQGQFATANPLLLAVLVNARLLDGSFKMGAGGAAATLVPRMLSDHSARVSVPANWAIHSLGAGQFLACDPSRSYGFMVAAAFAVSPNMRVRGQGFVVSRFLPPRQALPFFAGRQGLMRNVRLLATVPRPDAARLASSFYRAGPILAEEFLYTFTNREGAACKAYTFGISFGSHLGSSWRLWHMTVFARHNLFDACASNFVAMLKAYALNDQYVKQYVANGLQRLRELQAQTAQIVSRNAEEIRRINLSIHQNKMKSMDYTSYLFTRYMRGEQDWVSSTAGGRVYRSDTWGTKDLATGEYVSPVDYIHYQGQTRYGQMQSVNTRELYERYVRSR